MFRTTFASFLVSRFISRRGIVISSLLNVSCNLKIFVQTPTAYEVLSQFSQALLIFVN